MKLFRPKYVGVLSSECRLSSNKMWFLKNRKILLIFLSLLLVAFVLVKTNWREPRRDEVRHMYLKQLALGFADKYKDRSVILVSKRDHLLYYCEKGKLVENDYWNGCLFTFPVKISIANRWYRTPEGLVHIDRKNGRSRYTLFLGLSFPGDYGIHGAPTYLASFLARMEIIDPNFTFVTKKDDTRGCVAVENRVIKYLFAKVDLNTPVLILP